MAGKITGLGDTGSNIFESIRDMEEQVRAKQKAKKEEDLRLKENTPEGKLAKVSELIGKNNEEAFKLLQEMVKNNEISADKSLSVIEEIKASMIEQDEYLAIQQAWLEDQQAWRKEREEQRKDKEKELSLWNVLKAGIRGLILDAKGKKARKTFNKGILILGERFFHALAKGFIDFIKVGVEAFKGMLFWTILISALLALLDPSGAFLDALIGSIMAILPIVINAITRIVEFLPTFLKRFIYIFAKIWKEVFPTILNALAEVLPILIEAIKTIIPLLIDVALEIVDILIEMIPKILIMTGQLLDGILSAIFGKQIKIFEPLFTFIGNLFATLVPLFIDILKEILPILVDILTIILPPVLKLLQISLTNIIAIIKPLISMVGGFLKVIKGILTLDSDLIMEGLIQVGKGLFQFMTKFITSTFLLIPKLLIQGIGKMFFGKKKLTPEERRLKKLEARRQREELKTFFMGLGEGMDNIFEKIKAKVMDLPPIKAVKEFFSDINTKFQGLKTWFKKSGLVKIIKQFINKMKEGFFELIAILGGFFKFMGYALTHPVEALREGIAGIKAGIQAEAFKIRTGSDIDIKNIARREMEGKAKTREIETIYKQLDINPAEVKQAIQEEKRKTGKDVKIDRVVDIITELANIQKYNAERENRALNQQGSKSFHISTESIY